MRVRQNHANEFEWTSKNPGEILFIHPHTKYTTKNENKS